MRARMARKQRSLLLQRALLESLEPRTLMSVTFGNADMSGTWITGAKDTAGPISFDASGNVTGGSLRDADGYTQLPVGSYVIHSDGTLSVVTGNDNAFNGAMNTAKDLVVGTSIRVGSVGLAVAPAGATFTTSDLAGTWFTAINGEAGDTNGVGTLTIDSSGQITAGTIPDGAELYTITGGLVTLDASGATTASVVAHNHDNVFSTLTLSGGLNGSKDLLVLSPLDFQDSSNAGTTLIVGVKSSGTYSDADLSGTWVIATGGGNGWLVLDGAGNITSGQISSGGTAEPVTGTYTVDASGHVTVDGTVVSGGMLQALTFSGAINKGKNALVMNTTDLFSSYNLTALVASAEHANHAPALSSIGVLETASTGKPFSITFDTLLAASNASDVDSDLLQFQVTALGGGALSLNGAPVAPADLPVVVAATDTLEWTPRVGALGSANAFTVVADDGTLVSSAVVVRVETVPPSIFTNTDVTGTWAVGGTNVVGTIAFDGDGNIIGGLVQDVTGSVNVPSGGYDVSEDGAITGNEGNNFVGGLNSSKDVIAATDPSSGLQVVINSGALAFTDADFAGTWTLGFNGQQPSSNGLGRIVMDGAGNVTAGVVVTGAGTTSLLGGTYTSNGDGTVSMVVLTPGPTSAAPTEMDLFGVLNASRDVLIMSPTDLPTAYNNQDSTFMALVRTGSATAADVRGTWTLASDDVSGSVVLDGAGHISGGLLHMVGVDATPSGTYTVSGTSLRLNVALSASGSQFSQVSFIGGVNLSHNTIVMNQVGSSTYGNLVVMVNPANHAPTMSTVAALGTAIASKPLTIGYDELLAASNAHDLDGNAISFQIGALGVGTLELNGVAVSAGSLPVYVMQGDELTWTPPAATKGKLTGFTVKAFDGTTASAKALPVAINTVLMPTVAIGSIKATATEKNATGSGTGFITLVRSAGILSEPLDAHFTLSGAADASDYQLLLNGNPVTSDVTFPAGVKQLKLLVVPNDDDLAKGTRGVTLTLASDSEYLLTTKNRATVNIADNEPTISITATKATATELNGQTTGFGKFTLTRTAPFTSPLTVQITIGGTAGNGIDYGAPGTASLTTSVTFLAGSASAVITINPIDDALIEAAETVQLTVVPDGAPHYFVGTRSTATVTIANHTPVPAVLTGAAKNVPLQITYDDLLAASGLQSGGSAITFKVVGIKSGSLWKNGVAVTLNSTTLSTGESWYWIPPTNALGIKPAFSLVAQELAATTLPMIFSASIT